MFGDDYVRFHPFLEQGNVVLITGSFKQRFNRGEYEFKTGSITVAENVKKMLTRELCLEIDVRNLEQPIIDFLENNIRSHPGSSVVKVQVAEPKNAWKATLTSMGFGFEMNHEMISFLESRPEIDVQVVT